MTVSVAWYKSALFSYYTEDQKCDSLCSLVIIYSYINTIQLYTLAI
jgi:hypothetical protein